MSGINYDRIWRKTHPLMSHDVGCIVRSDDGGECDCGLRERTEGAAKLYTERTGHNWNDAPTIVQHLWMSIRLLEPRHD